MAVLFVDIVGFTSFASTQEPEEVIETLREFHGLMEACVFDNHGTLDKFSAMASWPHSAPPSKPPTIHRTVSAAPWR